MHVAFVRSQPAIVQSRVVGVLFRRVPFPRVGATGGAVPGPLSAALVWQHRRGWQRHFRCRHGPQVRALCRRRELAAAQIEVRINILQPVIHRTTSSHTPLKLIMYHRLYNMPLHTLRRGALRDFLVNLRFFAHIVLWIKVAASLRPCK